MSQRTVVIDDDDSGITYTGSWFRDQGSYSALGNFGAPFSNTLHGTNSSGSLSYQFVGSMVQVTTTLQFANPTGLAIQCLVDNQDIPVINSTNPENNLQLCISNGLSDGSHIFTLIANVTNQETFWFDYLSYVPSSSVSLDQATLSIPSSDSQVQLGFGTGWTSFFPGFKTQQTGSQFHFDFTGVSLIWYGFYDPSLPWDTNLNTATYSIDGGTAIPFNTAVNAASVTTKPTGVAYNQLLFQSADFPAGPHKLEVLYQGSNATTPLNFEFIVIRRTASPSSAATSASSISATSTSSTSTPTSTDQGSTSAPPHKSNHTGAIVGAVVGALGLLALALILFLYLRRRRGRRDSEEETGSLRRLPDMYQPSSFPATHTRGDSSANTATTGVPTSPSQMDASYSGSHNTPSALAAPPNGLLRLHPGGLTVVNPSMHSLSPSASAPPSTPRKGSVTTGRSRFIQDEDSGIRLNSDGNEVEILPPVYSAM